MDRIILHCDCNSFFASVETLFHPEYAKVPMAVAGSEEARHGIILAKNQLAGKYGIRTAETVREAKRKCPELLLVPPRYGEYAKVSARVRRIYERYTELVEPFGMDECWLDVTGSVKLFGSGEKIAEEIRRAVKKEIGITVSIGVSFNKIFAKLGSDYKKPDAITVISRGNFSQIVHPLSVDSLLFVGRKTAEELRKNGIRSVGELAAASPLWLEMKFGKMGMQLGKYARGEDDSPVASVYESADPKSVGSGMTFRRDLVTEEEIRLGLSTLAEDVAHRLRKVELVCTTVSVQIKDVMLRSISRQKPQDPPSDLAREITQTAMDIVKDSWNIGTPIRLLTVTAMNLVPSSAVVEQIGFFDGMRDERRRRNERLEDAVDHLRAKFGVDSVKSGAVIGNDLGISEHGSKKTKGYEEGKRNEDRNGNEN